MCVFIPFIRSVNLLIYNAFDNVNYGIPIAQHLVIILIL